MHRIEHRRRHDRLKHLPCGRHIMHFIEIEFSGVVTPTRSAKCAAKKMTAVTAFVKSNDPKQKAIRGKLVTDCRS
jgi:hypothetical protein